MWGPFRKGLLWIWLVVTTIGNSSAVQILGNPEARITWVYLCGLTYDNQAPQDIENRKILDDIGKRLNLKFLAIHPFDRCEPADNKLCWIHYTPEQTVETYEKIRAAIGNREVSGFIGFSNGGFFLNQLVQMRELNLPIISIGAAGSFFSPTTKNQMTLIVGKSEFMYESALKYVKSAEGSALSIRFIEHNGDHILPGDVLEHVLKHTLKGAS